MPARVNLYEELYDDLINDRGHNAIWEQAAVCSCVSRDTGQPDFTCPICHGKGYRYLPGKRIFVVVTSMSGKIELNTLETREPGVAYVTPKANILMGYMDRLRFPDFSCKFSEVLKWDEGRDGRGVSPRTYRNIRDVVSLTDAEHEYEKGIDYHISADQYHLVWDDQSSIDKLDSRNMSVLYLTTPSYLVVDLLHELRATMSDRKTPGITFRKLPNQYKVQREDFIYGVTTPDPARKPADEGANPKTESHVDTDGGIVIP